MAKLSIQGAMMFSKAPFILKQTGLDDWVRTKLAKLHLIHKTCINITAREAELG